jgi:hypothetical protein
MLFSLCLAGRNGSRMGRKAPRAPFWVEEGAGSTPLILYLSLSVSLIAAHLQVCASSPLPVITYTCALASLLRLYMHARPRTSFTLPLLHTHARPPAPTIAHAEHACPPSHIIHVAAAAHTRPGLHTALLRLYMHARPAASLLLLHTHVRTHSRAC